GKLVAAGNEDGRIRLWEVISRKVRREFASHAGGVRAIALFPDETRLLSGGEDGKILVWELAGAAVAKPRAALDAATQEKEWHARGPPLARRARGFLPGDGQIWGCPGLGAKVPGPPPRAALHHQTALDGAIA